MATRRLTHLPHGRHPLRSNSPQRNTVVSKSVEYSKSLSKGKVKDNTGSDFPKTAFTPDSNRDRLVATSQQRPQVIQAVQLAYTHRYNLQRVYILIQSKLANFSFLYCMFQAKRRLDLDESPKFYAAGFKTPKVRSKKRLRRDSEPYPQRMYLVKIQFYHKFVF